MISKKELSILRTELPKYLMLKAGFSKLSKIDQTKYLTFFYLKILKRESFRTQDISPLFILCRIPMPSNIFVVFSDLRKKDIFIPIGERAYTLHRDVFDKLDKEFRSDKRRGLKIDIFDKMGIHPKIREVSEERFLKKDFSVAIERAFKRVIKLVQERSGKNLDGTSLMESVFSPKNPILAFNERKTQSEIDEQTGMMNLFKGAVSCIRNVRFHEEIDDDEEIMAFHHVIFASFLIKKLDESFTNPDYKP